MTPTEILAAARALMERPDAATAGVWPRASAFLIRQALETALNDGWVAQAATDGVAGCSMRTQLLCAPSYLEPAIAEQVAWAWTCLSRACHYHQYELAPTAVELTDWMTTVDELILSLTDPKKMPRNEAIEAKM